MERLLKAHLVEFDLPIKTLCLLERGGIRTLGDLVRQSRETLLQLPQIGTTNVKTLEKFLSHYRLSLSK